MHERDHATAGLGIARALMVRALEELRAHGFSSASLWVLAANDRARRFYVGAGFHQEPAAKTVEVGGISLEELRYARALAE